MEKLLTVCSVILFAILIGGCERENVANQQNRFTRLEVSKMIYDQPDDRVPLWNAIGMENQFAIWQDKISQILSQDLSNEWRVMFDDLNKNMTYEQYRSASEHGLVQVTYLSNWIDDFSRIATEEERYATIGCIFDYNAKTNSINLNNIININVDSEKQGISKLIIRPRDRPGTGLKCDCRWGGCPIGDEYECKPSGTTDCSQTTAGCGFLLFQSCTHFCVNCILWDCEQY